jgi:hypothetical protein
VTSSTIRIFNQNTRQYWCSGFAFYVKLSNYFHCLLNFVCDFVHTHFNKNILLNKVQVNISTVDSVYFHQAYLPEKIWQLSGLCDKTKRYSDRKYRLQVPCQVTSSTIRIFNQNTRQYWCSGFAFYVKLSLKLIQKTKYRHWTKYK